MARDIPISHYHDCTSNSARNFLTELHIPTSRRYCHIFPSWRQIIGGSSAWIVGMVHPKAFERPCEITCFSSCTVKCAVMLRMKWGHFPLKVRARCVSFFQP